MIPAPSSRTTIEDNVARIRADIAGACSSADRDPSTVRLVAASKTVPVERVRWAHEAGVEDFGENYLKELLDKAPQVPEATWHYIGTLQSGTAHKVADAADVVETIASQRASERLARRASSRGRRLEVLIEVDFTGERAGVRPDDVPAAASKVASLEGLRLAGLMTMPPIPAHPEDSRPYFARLRECRDGLLGGHPSAVELSMGMSMDFRIAVEEGATMVRIGTALFGERPPKG